MSRHFQEMTCSFSFYQRSSTGNTFHIHPSLGLTIWRPSSSIPVACVAGAQRGGGTGGGREFGQKKRRGGGGDVPATKAASFASLPTVLR